MSDLYMLSEVQMRRIEPYFPLSHGVPRVDEPLPGRRCTHRRGGSGCRLVPQRPRSTQACIPSKASRKVCIPPDKILYRQRHKIENMFGKLKDFLSPM
jgi:transposase